jgi:uncharacterized protein (TIGR02246 family)
MKRAKSSGPQIIPAVAGPEAHFRSTCCTTITSRSYAGMHEGLMMSATIRSKLFLLGAAFVSLGSPEAMARQAGTGTMKTPATLEAVIAQSHEALRQILNGDPSGYAALFAQRDDITLGNPFGPFGKGRTAVLAALHNAAVKYRDGMVVAVDRIAVYGDARLVCLVEIEHDRAKLGTSPDFVEFAARVTSVYEKIGGRWKLVHRHADPITSPRAAESVLGK